jgi:hypothetical protein
MCLVVDDLLFQLSHMFHQQIQQTIFLINNYDLVLSVLKVNTLHHPLVQSCCHALLNFCGCNNITTVCSPVMCKKMTEMLTLLLCMLLFFSGSWYRWWADAATIWRVAQKQQYCVCGKYSFSLSIPDCLNGYIVLWVGRLWQAYLKENVSGIFSPKPYHSLVNDVRVLREIASLVIIGSI